MAGSFVLCNSRLVFDPNRDAVVYRRYIATNELEQGRVCMYCNLELYFDITNSF